MVVATQTQFDESNPRYYTCGCCHVRTGVIVISIIKIVILLLAILGAVFAPVHNVTYDHPTMSHVNVKWSVPVCAIIMVVCAVLAIVGMRDNKPAFLIPQIVMQVIALVMILVFFLCVIIPGINMGPSAIIIIIIMFGLALVFAVWFLVMFVRGYKYLKDKKEFLVNNQNSIVAGSVSIAGCNPISVYAGGQQASGQPNYTQFGYAKAP